MNKYLEKVSEIRSDLLDRFKPDFTPEEMEALGVLADQYPHDTPDYRNYFGTSASLKTWPDKWKDKDTAPMGWYQWYKGYMQGKRTPDDERQIKRWLSYKARHMGSLVKADPTLSDTSVQTRRRQALLNWGINAGVNPSDIDRVRILNKVEERKK